MTAMPPSNAKAELQAAAEATCIAFANIQEHMRRYLESAFAASSRQQRKCVTMLRSIMKVPALYVARTTIISTATVYMVQPGQGRV